MTSTSLPLQLREQLIEDGINPEEALCAPLGAIEGAFLVDSPIPPTRVYLLRNVGEETVYCSLPLADYMKERDR